MLGLGCENNNIAELKKALGKLNDERIRFLNCQDYEDEIAQGISIIKELQAIADKDRRETVPVSKLKIGLKCGGSDGLSGITANPMCGRITDKTVAMGGTAILTEVPEMFGAEQLLMNRCINETVFNKTVNLINNYKTILSPTTSPSAKIHHPETRRAVLQRWKKNHSAVCKKAVMRR